MKIYLQTIIPLILMMSSVQAMKVDNTKESKEAVDKKNNQYNPDDLKRALAGDKKLAGANLQGIELKEGLDLNGADLTNANLSNIRTGGIDLTNARLIRTNMQGAQIRDMDITNSLLDQVDLSNSRINNIISKEGAQIINNTTFEHAHLSYIRIYESTLSDINFSGATITTRWTVMGCTLNNISMQECKINNLTLTDCSGNNINFQGATLENFHMTLFSERKIKNHVINGRVWKNLDFRNATLLDCCFIGDVLTLFNNQEKRVPELSSLKPTWYYKLSVILNPLQGAQRTLSHYDEYNANSAFVNARFEKTLFLGVTATNIVLQDCTGIEDLEKRKKGCFFANIVIHDTEKNTVRVINTD